MRAKRSKATGIWGTDAKKDPKGCEGSLQGALGECGGCAEGRVPKDAGAL